MIILRESTSDGETRETMGACDGTVCRYEGGDYWLDDTDRLKIGSPPVGREQEWISVEFEANTRTGMIRLYVDTQDGDLSGLYHRASHGRYRHRWHVAVCRHHWWILQQRLDRRCQQLLHGR